MSSPSTALLPLSRAAGGVPQVVRADSHEAAADYLHKILEPGDTILFKGSRGMQMEKIIDLL